MENKKSNSALPKIVLACVVFLCFCFGGLGYKIYRKLPQIRELAKAINDAMNAALGKIPG